MPFLHMDCVGLFGYFHSALYNQHEGKISFPQYGTFKPVLHTLITPQRSSLLASQLGCQFGSASGDIRYYPSRGMKTRDGCVRVPTMHHFSSNVIARAALCLGSARESERPALHYEQRVKKINELIGGRYVCRL